MKLITPLGQKVAANMRMNRHVYMTAVINRGYIINIPVSDMKVLLRSTLDVL
jgi:hypothetical protein